MLFLLFWVISKCLFEIPHTASCFTKFSDMNFCCSIFNDQDAPLPTRDFFIIVDRFGLVKSFFQLSQENLRWEEKMPFRQRASRDLLWQYITRKRACQGENTQKVKNFLTNRHIRPLLAFGSGLWYTAKRDWSQWFLCSLQTTGFYYSGVWLRKRQSTDLSERK